MNSLTISTGWGGGWLAKYRHSIRDAVVGPGCRNQVQICSPYFLYIYVHVEVTDLSELFILENIPTHDSTVSECGIFITKEQSF